MTAEHETEAAQLIRMLGDADSDRVVKLSDALQSSLDGQLMHDVILALCHQLGYVVDRYVAFGGTASEMEALISRVVSKSASLCAEKLTEARHD